MFLTRPLGLDLLPFKPLQERAWLNRWARPVRWKLLLLFSARIVVAVTICLVLSAAGSPQRVEPFLAFPRYRAAGPAAPREGATMETRAGEVSAAPRILTLLRKDSLWAVRGHNANTTELPALGNVTGVEMHPEYTMTVTLRYSDKPLCSTSLQLGRNNIGSAGLTNSILPAAQHTQSPLTAPGMKVQNVV